LSEEARPSLRVRNNSRCTPLLPNPIGLIVVGGLNVYGEASGRNKLEGRAKATPTQLRIADELRIRFQDRGWIS
jgi:hypothetical protein